DISTCMRVEYRDVYPGISLVYHGDHGNLEFDFNIAPNANPTAITLQFDGADKLWIGPGGDLVVEASGLRLHFEKPFAYQNINGRSQPVDSEYIVDDMRVKFRVSSYDTTKSLVIDPILAYSNTLGASESQSAYAITVD